MSEKQLNYVLRPLQLRRKIWRKQNISQRNSYGRRNQNLQHKSAVVKEILFNLHNKFGICWLKKKGVTLVPACFVLWSQSIQGSADGSHPEYILTFKVQVMVRMVMSHLPGAHLPKAICIICLKELYLLPEASGVICPRK